MEYTNDVTDGPFRVEWAKLNNAVFALIYADEALRARYDAADSTEAREICADQVDRLAADPAEFVERFIVVER